MTNEFDNIIGLNDENGNDVEFEFLDLIVYNDEESYVSVGDDNTLMAVFNIFKDKFKDEFNFVD